MAEQPKKPTLGDRYKTPPEIIQDGEITLRRWTVADADDLLAAATASLPELKQWMPWAQNGYTMDTALGFLTMSTADWDANKEYNYTLIYNGEISGSLGLMDPAVGGVGMALGYWVATPVTGRGLATRAARLLTRTAFEAGAEVVQIWHRVENEKSKAVPRKLGYRFVGEQMLPETRFEGLHWVWEMKRPDDT